MTTLAGIRVRLRRATVEDASARFALGRDLEICRMFGISQDDVVSMTMEAARGWAQSHAGDPHAWMIEVQGRLIGEIKLHSIDARDRRASMAIGIYDRTQLNKGLGTEAIKLLLRHAFEELHLHRISIRVLAYNDRAIRAYAKCGFKVEGRERETAFVDGQWHDDVMMGLLAREYQP